ncbi:MAG TPA: nitroreductase family protein [Ktedonobacteraceae bacterium]|nr:nitroreductase family protein [Ktedonobacteraceae bacterium]
MTIDTEPRPSTLPRRADSLAALMQGRRSVRQFQQKPVERALIEQILEAARWAPSPHGRQPWRFVVITRQETKMRLAQDMGAAWRRNLEMDGQATSVVEIRQEKSRQRILNAPAIIIPCLYLEDLDRYPDEQRQADETTMAIQSLGAAIQNMLLMAYDLGLDAGWMCAPLFCPEMVCDTLSLDKRLIPQAMIAVGYAAADPKRRARLPLSSLVVYFEE